MLAILLLTAAVAELGNCEPAAPRPGSAGVPGVSLGEVGDGVRACCGSEGGVERIVMCRSKVAWAIATVSAGSLS